MEAPERKSGIDFVVSWVDGSDPDWLASRAEYASRLGETRMNEARFRDWDLFKYWFRGVERCAPWVDNVHFVTWGHIPAWLNVDHPKLKIVRHEDYIPAQYLPTFNSHAIELNMHRIPGLSRRFVYFNDDVYMLRPVQPRYFFRHGLPRDYIGLDSIFFRKGTAGHIMAEDIEVINDHFDYPAFVRRSFFRMFNPLLGIPRLVKNVFMCASVRKYFPGFSGRHAFMAFDKATFEEVWKAEPEKLARTCECRFRRKDNVSPWLMRYWQLAKGTFASASPSSYGCRNLRKDNLEETVGLIRGRRYSVLCVNDNSFIEDFDGTRRAIHAAFEQILPEPSSFERSR